MAPFSVYPGDRTWHPIKSPIEKVIFKYLLYKNESLCFSNSKPDGNSDGKLEILIK